MAVQPHSRPRNILTHGWRVSLRARGVAVLAVPLAALFAALFSIYWVEGDVRNAEQTVMRTYAMRGGLVELRSSLLDAQTAVSGYLATAEPHFLTLYEASRRKIEQTLSQASTQVRGDSQGTESLAGIQRLAAEEVRVLDQLRATVPGHGAAALQDRERTIMGDLQAKVTLLGEHQERLFTQAGYDRDLARGRLFRTVIVCGILGPLGALFIHLLLAGRMVRRVQAVEENARRLAHGLPLEPLPKGSDEIAALGVQLEDAAYLLRERERELANQRATLPRPFRPCPDSLRRDRSGGRRYALQPGSLHAAAMFAGADDRPPRLEFHVAAAAGRGTRSHDGPHSKRPGGGPLRVRIRAGRWHPLTVEIRENLIRNDRGEVTGTIRSSARCHRAQPGGRGSPQGGAVRHGVTQQERAVGTCPGSRALRHRGQEPLSGQRLPRTADAAERDHRLQRVAARWQARPAYRRSDRCARRHTQQRAPSAPTHQRRSRPFQGGGGAHGVSSRSTAGLGRWHTKSAMSSVPWRKRRVCALPSRFPPTSPQISTPGASSRSCITICPTPSSSLPAEAV